MSNVRPRLQSLVRSPQDGRVRAIWRILVPVLAGFLALQFVSTVAFTFDLNRGQMMVAAFAGTTGVMAVVLGVSARYLDRRSIREYGYRLSRDWWLDVAAGIGLGTFIIALSFVIGRYTGSLEVTSGGLLPDAATFGWLLVFFAAFAGVAFYEEYIYRGSFITNAVEGLTARGITGRVATVVALLGSTLAFAVVHLPSAIAADANIALVIVKAGLLGGLFGITYLHTGELAFPMGLHLGVNYAVMNVFGIGAAGIPGFPSLLTVELTGTGLWNPARGIPLFVAILVGSVFVIAWTRWRDHDRPTHQHNRFTLDHSDS